MSRNTLGRSGAAVALVLCLLGCSKEADSNSESAGASGAPAASVAPTDSPDKLFPELAKAYETASAQATAYVKSGSTDAEFFKQSSHGEIARFRLWQRASAMLTAHPEWKETTIQWFERTAKPKMLTYNRQMMDVAKQMNDPAKLAAFEQLSTKIKEDPVIAAEMTPEAIMRRVTQWMKIRDQFGIGDAATPVAW